MVTKSDYPNHCYGGSGQHSSILSLMRGLKLSRDDAPDRVLFRGRSALFEARSKQGFACG